MRQDSSVEGLLLKVVCTECRHSHSLVEHGNTTTTTSYFRIPQSTGQLTRASLLRLFPTEKGCQFSWLSSLSFEKYLHISLYNL